MNGIILVNKPINWTSFDVVAKIRSICTKSSGQKTKVGHAGTLDPLADGLLIILVGNYCKKAQDYSKKDKKYLATMILGQTSTTDDEEGEKQVVSSKIPEIKEINKTLQSFLGLSKQTPPNFSAIKIKGQRAYKLAREGKQVEIKPKDINIYSITDVNYMYPKLSFKVEVSSGTYIRSLARDIGDKLGTGGYLSSLTRVSIGSFKLENAHSLIDLDEKTIHKAIKTL